MKDIGWLGEANALNLSGEEKKFYYIFLLLAALPYIKVSNQ